MSKQTKRQFSVARVMSQNSHNTSPQNGVKSNQTTKQLVQQLFHKSMFTSEKDSSPSGPTTSDDCSQDTPVHEQEIIPPPVWQTIPVSRAKRIRTSSSPTSRQQIPLDNRFYELPLDDVETEKTQKDAPGEKRKNKPPPLILYGVRDVNKLIETIETILVKTDYVIKIVTKNHLKVNCASAEAYKNLMRLVREKGLIGHTFTHKDEKCYRIVIKNLHHTTPHEEIVKEIEKTGNKVSGEIINARYGPDKTPTSTFFVNLERSANNKEVKNLRYIYNTCVTIEDPRKRKTIVQCSKCQQYGHTKNNCFRPYRCVKCAESHRTADCPKTDRNSPAKCALCFGNHPANYKGCEVYREIASRKNKIRVSTKERRAEDNKNPEQTESQQLPETDREPTNTKKTYAHVLKNNQQYPHVEPTQVVQDLLIKQSEKIDMLLQQISTLMGLMTKLIDKLIK